MTEKGTYQFQEDLLRFHLDVYAVEAVAKRRRLVHLREFLVRPGWDGGNPVPTPPFHQKAVIGYDGTAKPAYYDLQAAFRATQQYPAPAP